MLITEYLYRNSAASLSQKKRLRPLTDTLPGGSLHAHTNLTFQVAGSNMSTALIIKTTLFSG